LPHPVEFIAVGVLMNYVYILHSDMQFIVGSAVQIRRQCYLITYRKVFFTAVRRC